MLPECGVHVTGSAPSPGSFAATLYVTRARFAPLGAMTALERAPLITGGVVSNVYPGTVSVPDQVSFPAPVDRWTSTTVPLPCAPAYTPVPPVTVKSKDTGAAEQLQADWATAEASISPLPATVITAAKWMDVVWAV